MVDMFVDEKRIFGSDLGFNMSYDKIQWVHQALILRFCFLRLAADFIAFARFPSLCYVSCAIFRN